MVNVSGIFAKNQSVLLAKIDNQPTKLVYQTWIRPDLKEQGEWKSADGSFDCNVFDATNVIVVESSEDEMPVNFFDRYPDIERIEMTSKRLKSIKLTDLLNANALQHLNVSHNEIDSIEAFAFDSAPKLNEIDLSFNLLQNLNENVFASYLIKYLYLNNNQLTVVRPEWFENLLYLRVLTLNNNRIRAIDWRILEFWPNINVLHLHSNEIAEMHNYMQTPRSMQTFSIHDNPVDVASHHMLWLDTVAVDVRNTGVQFCQVTERMATLIAANNEIREINLDNLSAPNENALVTLDLANNILESIENVTHFHRLQYLNLSHNLLTRFDAKVFVPLKDLQQLDLSYNKLKRFAVVNQRLPSLISLDVSFNEISMLDLSGIMSQLETLHVDGNRIKTTVPTLKKKRHSVNHESQCLSDSTTCSADQKDATINQNYENHPIESKISDEIRDVIYEHFHIMEKNILQLIDSQLQSIKQRIDRLDQEMVRVTIAIPDKNFRD